jgi:uncharacterized protein (TIGR01777 family)
MERKTILIAGGSGLIGRSLCDKLRNKGHVVYVLSRSPKKAGDIFWNPVLKQLDNDLLKDVQVIINLTGEGIGEKNWTQNRKVALRNSRIQTASVLFEKAKTMAHLEYYIGASGVNCYGFEGQEEKNEAMPYGNDFLSELVQEWERASDLFSEKCPVVKLRIAAVLSGDGGLLKKFQPLLKLRLFPFFGDGKQLLSWIHIDDLCQLFDFCIEQRPQGSFNAVSANDSSYAFAKTLLKKSERWGTIIRIPGWFIKTVFGEMSVVILKGIRVSNAKIKAAGFVFKYATLEDALSIIKKP